MKTSANAMKATVKESDLDKADELMEDMNEAMDQINEMNEAMSQPIGQMMDDDELEAELAELEELEADELLNDMANAPQQNAPQSTFDANVMPDAPSSAISLDTHSITHSLSLSLYMFECESMWVFLGLCLCRETEAGRRRRISRIGSDDELIIVFCRCKCPSV